MQDLNSSSFDLELARASSQKLRGAAEGHRPTADGEYVRLRRDPSVESPRRSEGPLKGQAAPASAPAIETGGSHRFGANNWNAMLDWCLSRTGGAGGFVIDGSGLVVASRGELAEIEGVGARLMMAMEQVQHLSSDDNVLRVSIGFDGQWLIGIRILASHSAPLTLGMVTAAPIATATQDEIERAFSRLVR